MARFLKVSFVIFFCLSSVLFFRPVFIPNYLWYYLYYGFFMLATIFIFTGIGKLDHTPYNLPLLLILGAILLSSFSAALFWSQGLVKSVMALPLYMSYILFFLLVVWKIRSEEIEKVIIMLGFTYLAVYAVTFLSFPKPIFGNIEGFSTDRGFQRVMLEGRGFLFLFSFYTLNRYYRKREIFWLLMFIISAVSVMMLLTRTLIAVSIVLWTFYILRKSRYIAKFFAALVIGLSLFFIFQLNFSRILFRQTVNQTEDLNNYVRIRAAAFYIREFSPNFIARVIGNGEPYKGTGYADYMTFLEKEKGLYTSDIGYVGLWTKFGLLSLLAWLLLFMRSVKLRIPDDRIYSKYFLYFVFIISIIIDAPFSPSFITPFVLALYLMIPETEKSE